MNCLSVKPMIPGSLHKFFIRFGLSCFVGIRYEMWIRPKGGTPTPQQEVRRRSNTWATDMLSHTHRISTTSHKLYWGAWIYKNLEEAFPANISWHGVSRHNGHCWCHCMNHTTTISTSPLMQHYFDTYTTHYCTQFAAYYLHTRSLIDDNGSCWWWWSSIPQ
jgi:hypothetical protein